jgi:hypothetical protein
VGDVESDMALFEASDDQISNAVQEVLPYTEGTGYAPLVFEIESETSGSPQNRTDGVACIFDQL